MKLKRKQLAQNQSPLCTLQGNLILLQPSVSSTDHCKAHKSRELAVTARGSYWGITTLELDAAPWVCLARVNAGGDTHCPGLLGDIPSSAAQDTVCLLCKESTLSAQFLVLRANIQLVEAGTDQSFLKSSQGVGGHRIWPSLNDSRFGPNPYEAKLPEPAGVWPKSVLRILKIIILCNSSIISRLVYVLEWGRHSAAQNTRPRVQHAHLQYSLEIQPWGW